MNVGDLFKIKEVAGFDGPSPENQLVEMEGLILREDLKLPTPERPGRRTMAQSCRNGLRNGRHENSEGGARPKKILQAKPLNV